MAHRLDEPDDWLDEIEDYSPEEEMAEIHADPALMDQIRRSEVQYAAGMVESWEAVKFRLGLKTGRQVQP